MSLRARLLAAFAYSLLVVIVALEVPLASNLCDRVNAEVGATPPPRSLGRRRFRRRPASNVRPLEQVSPEARRATQRTHGHRGRRGKEIASSGGAPPTGGPQRQRATRSLVEALDGTSPGPPLREPRRARHGGAHPRRGADDRRAARSRQSWSEVDEPDPHTTCSPWSASGYSPWRSAWASPGSSAGSHRRDR